MSRVKVRISDESGKSVLKEYEGEFYRGYGIVKWLSAGRQAPFCIHLATGRIIPMLTGGNDEDDVKDKIDLSSSVIHPDMEYNEINTILNGLRHPRYSTN